MKANFDRLIDGAVGAAKTSYEAIGSTSPDLAGADQLCRQKDDTQTKNGRRSGRCAQILGDKTVLTGFYSYGEISPFTHGARCELHNQTMTITTFSSIDHGRDNSLLKRQIKKSFGAAFHVPVQWEKFIEAVDAAYKEFDTDRTMLERSIDLSSQELLQANSEMRAIFHAIP